MIAQADSIAQKFNLMSNQLEDISKQTNVHISNTVDEINASQVKNTLPSHQAIAYTGRFNHSVYGEILIGLKNNDLQVQYRSLNATLHHWHYDQFITMDDGRGFPDLRISFLTNDKGEIDRISTRPFGDPLTEFVRVK
jgi:hypothetical protein